MTEPFDQSELMAKAEALVAAARAAGADAADAVALRSVSLAVEVRLGKVEETERAEGDSIGLRVFVGRRPATVSTNTAEDPRALAERAVAMAKVAPEDAYAGLADPALLIDKIPDLDLVDNSAPDAQDLTEAALAAEEAALAVAGVSNSGGASASWRLGGMVLATSSGFAGRFLASAHGISATALAGSGTAMERDYDYSSARHRGDLADPAAIGRLAGERAVKRLDPRKVQSRTATVVFEPRTAGSLVSHLASAANGASVARGTSFLKDRRGGKVFRDGVTIVDDPLRRRGLRSAPFDGEGVAGHAMEIVADGVLAEWLLDSATARELQLSTNGRARRGTAGAPSPGTSNLYMKPGRRSPAEIIGEIEAGLYVTDLIGHGVDLVTGDYSRGVAGFWIENGEITYAVSEITVAGNLADMFARLEPASDLEFRYGVDAPTIAIEGMTIAGQ
ncbi:MAG TPA: TldD/PmbA family protein [Hyphomicrobiales bacterium]|nr:TldD/PmbA family protein [Kaistiaceae bacterium]HQF30446.1 TldD/PmbA family protein [Hyphomicrobiales bacterium]